MCDIGQENMCVCFRAAERRVCLVLFVSREIRFRGLITTGTLEANRDVKNVG